MGFQGVYLCWILFYVLFSKMLFLAGSGLCLTGSSVKEKKGNGADVILIKPRPRTAIPCDMGLTNARAFVAVTSL
jgi:hypothetical protein